MPIPKTTRARNANPRAVSSLLKELEEFSDQFDESDPESVQVLLDEHITNLMTQGHISRRMDAPDLEDVLGYVLRGSVRQDLLSSAEAMRRLIESYGDMPSMEDMEEAHSLLREIIDGVREIAQGLVPQ
jgi:hypothetical protein